MQSSMRELQAHKDQLQQEIAGLGAPVALAAPAAEPGSEPSFRVFEVLARQLAARQICPESEALEGFRALLENSRRGHWTRAPVNYFTRWLDQNDLVRCTRNVDHWDLMLW